MGLSDTSSDSTSLPRVQIESRYYNGQLNKRWRGYFSEAENYWPLVPGRFIQGTEAALFLAQVDEGNSSQVRPLIGVDCD